MPDLAAGTPVTALDTPPAVYGITTTTVENHSSSGYTAPSSSIEIEFTAPTTGRVLILIQTGLDADVNAERARWDVQVREDDSSGTEIHPPSHSPEGGGEWYFNPHLPFFTSHVAMRYLPNLTAGQVYWAQLQYDTVGSTMDIQNQQLLAIPLP